MRHFARHQQPDFLSINADRWNQQWARLKIAHPGSGFQWYRFKNRPVNQLLTPLLSAQTQAHCSYCDAFPMGLADNTIDHFKPKGNPQFYLWAYQWNNLFYACADCQMAKKELFDNLLIAPDTPGYSFQLIFTYNFNTHEIEPNPGASLPDQQRGQITIKIFQLNHPSQITNRRHSWERWMNMPEDQKVLDDFAFRFIME